MQGQSIDTEEKERGFTSFFRQNLSVFNIVNNRNGGRYKYFHFDCNAGCGFNHEVNVIGSPVLFCTLARKSRTPFVMHAIEIDKGRAMELATSLKSDDSAFVINGDNAELLEMAPDVISQNGESPKFAIGSVLLDPNALKNGFPFKQLRRFCHECPRVDVLINYPANAYKRARNSFAEQPEWLVSLEDIPALSGKQHWLIKEPMGKWHFTLLVGRNEKYSRLSDAGFFEWDSEVGRRFRRRAMMTNEQMKKQPVEGQLSLWPHI